jgi:hypothetical protein
MSQFTDSEKARILREAHRFVRDRDKPLGATPSPEPPPIEIKFEDPMDRWRREADAATRQREAAKAAMQREQREGREAMGRARALDGAEARIAALEERMAEAERQVAQLSRAVGDFSDAVNAGFLSLDKQLEKLSTLLTSLRAADDQHRAVLDMPSPLIRKERVN